MEELVASKADLVVVASSNVLNTFRRFRLRRFVTVLNAPRKTAPVIEYAHSRPTRLYMSHVGREGLLVWKAMSGIRDLELHISGRIRDREATAILRYSNVKYHGLLTFEQVLRLEESVDAIIVLYDPKVTARSELGLMESNRFLEGLTLGKVVITNLKGSISEAVGCIFVDYAEPELRRAFQWIAENREEARRLGAQGRLLAERLDLFWENQARSLLSSYSEMLSPVE